MTRPEDIPQDIWDTAYEALHPLTREQYETSPFSMVLHLGMARAILAERERCVAAVRSSAIPHYMALGTVNSILNKIDPAIPAIEFTYPLTPTARFVLREPR